MFCPLKNTKRNVSDPNLLMSFSHLNFFPFKFGSKCDVCWFENAHISKRLNKNWIKSMVTQLDKAVLWSSPPPSLENPSQDPFQDVGRRAVYQSCVKVLNLPGRVDWVEWTEVLHLCSKRQLAVPVQADGWKTEGRPPLPSPPLPSPLHCWRI